jgi:NAD(P)-dependent dehydrogenase (short-subunit alcohol dehydrogenase family)
VGTSVLAGRTALVTGAASGIGLALGAELIARGARVVLTDLDGDAVSRRAAELDPGGNGRTRGVRLDVRDEDEFRSVVDEVTRREGAIDVLFNNAGISAGGPTHEFQGADWDRVVEVNLRGVINGILATYPAMIERGRGHIVNTASGAGLVAPPFVVAYAASKHAVVGLTLGLRPEAALHGVNVTVLCPGAVETPILDRPTELSAPSPSFVGVSPREYLATIRQRPVSADVVASRALDGVVRNRAIVVAPRSAAVPWYLHRLSPQLTQRLLAGIARRVDRALVRATSGRTG